MIFVILGISLVITLSTSLVTSLVPKGQHDCSKYIIRIFSPDRGDMIKKN
jgi:hypothetical protein